MDNEVTEDAVFDAAVDTVPSDDATLVTPEATDDTALLPLVMVEPNAVDSEPTELLIPT